MLFIFSLISELPLHPYEEERLRQCMSNSKRLRELGLPSMYFKIPGVHVDKNKSKQRNNEDSDSEYDPLQDDASEGDLFEDNAKVLICPSCYSSLVCLLMQYLFTNVAISSRALKKRPARKLRNKLQPCLQVE